MDILTFAFFWLALLIRYEKSIAFGMTQHHLSLEKASRSRLLQNFQASAHLQYREYQDHGFNSRQFYVTDFGADSTGFNDSTSALQQAINTMFNVSTKWHLISGIPDLGGAELNLQGGEYIISYPLTFPSKGGGNILIHGGTIRASAYFPSNRYLIELKSTTENEKTQQNLEQNKAYAFEDVKFRDLMLDASFRAGGLLISHALRTTVDNLYISHFETNGISVEAGHENYISNCFVGQYINAGNDPRERGFAGTGINIAGNDNIISNNVIFSASVGILVKGQANLLQGNHMYNKASGYGGIGIHVLAKETRIIGCYLDWNSIVADDPVQLEIVGSFFLGDGNIVLHASHDGSKMNSVIITNNMFSGNYRNVPTVQIKGKFSEVSRVLVSGNTAVGMQLKETVAKARLSGAGMSVWKLNLSQRLLFDNMIQNLQCSVVCEGSQFLRHVVRSIANNIVVVETDSPVNGTVLVAAEQCIE